MNYKILRNLPKSHKWKTALIAGRRLKGIIWDGADTKHNNVIYLYKKWASVHFDSDWYEITANSVADDKATVRDVSILKSLLKNNLNKKSCVIDVNCGTARHLIKLGKENIFGLGMEGASLLRKTGQELVREQKIPIKIVSTSKYFIRKYFEHADIVTSLFNAMGYTFNKTEDLKRLKWMASLIKNNGYLLLDIRAEEYQKQHFYTPVTTVEKMYLPADSNRTLITITTQKYWREGILAAEEIINIGIKNKEIVQNTTYGWKTYSLGELESMLKNVGMRLIEHKLDYYSSPENIGERIFLLSQKTKSV